MSICIVIFIFSYLPNFGGYFFLLFVCFCTVCLNEYIFFFALVVLHLFACSDILPVQVKLPFLNTVFPAGSA